MQIKELTGGDVADSNLSKPTDEELQNEYHYIFSEELTKKLLIEGFIKEEEYEKIMMKSRHEFKPFISKIMP